MIFVAFDVEYASPYLFVTNLSISLQFFQLGSIHNLFDSCILLELSVTFELISICRFAI